MDPNVDGVPWFNCEGTDIFSNVLYMVTFYRKYIGALTFEIVRK